MTLRRAAFLDRDGTLMEDSGFIGDPERIRVLDGVPEALRLLADAGYLRVVVTNQSGVARGYFGEPDVVRVNEALASTLAAGGATIDAFYYCTHLEGCDCRKPLPGLIRRAVADLGIDLRESVMFGDREPDVALAHGVGIPAVLIDGGAYRGPEPLVRVASLLEGVRFFLDRVHA
jgi:D-glycero-D-manno-heptose 1,7-bisphosphate phosphatase